MYIFKTSSCRARPGPRGLLSSQIAGIKFHWNCCILLYIAMQAYKKYSVCLGPSKVMGKIFCHMCMMKHTSQVHTWREVPMYDSLGSGQGAFWRSLVQSAPIFEPFLCKYYFFNFLLLNIFCGVNFFSGTCACGPMVLWIL